MLEKYFKKAHTQDEANFYYLKLKDLTDDEFSKVIDLIYKKCKYFPNIAEIRELIPSLEEKTMKKWETLKAESLDGKEKKWCKSFYYKYCNSEEEANLKIKKLELEE